MVERRCTGPGFSNLVTTEACRSIKTWRRQDSHFSPSTFYAERALIAIQAP
jgi:hypothetical protein